MGRIPKTFRTFSGNFSGSDWTKVFFFFFFDSNSSSAKNLIDHMVGMLEKYANNLEKIVEERTEQALEERKRADKLLEKMLPP